MDEQKSESLVTCIDVQFKENDDSESLYLGYLNMTNVVNGMTLLKVQHGDQIVLEIPIHIYDKELAKSVLQRTIGTLNPNQI